jgi:hypothetical protein
LYCCVKTGVGVNIADMGLNVLYDLIDYSAQIDALTLSKAEGKNTNYGAVSVEDMLARGKLRG